MGTLLQDLRYAGRTLRKAPGFTALVVLTLALGIGANTAIFSVVNALLLRPLPYGEPDRLVRLYQTFRTPTGVGTGSVSLPTFRDWQEQTRTFDGLAAYLASDVNLQGVDTPERLASVGATANLFEVLRARPQLGRGFAPGEEDPGTPPVAVLADGLWRQRFAADPAVIGRTIVLDGQAHTVVGVMPPEFRFPPASGGTQVWVPLQPPAPAIENRSANWLAVVGRLRPNVSLETAQAEMTAIAATLEQQYGEQDGRGALLRPVREVVVGDVRPRLLMLFGAAGFVLLIACANAANLLLARSTARRREIAVRTALGATRRRVVSQFLAEALLLAVAGAALGLLLARQTLAAVVALAGRSLPRATEVGFDVSVFGFLLLVTVVTAVAFGLVPALRATGARLHDDLKEGGVKASSGPGGGHFRSALVIAQIALSLVLLIGAGLLIRTLTREPMAELYLPYDYFARFFGVPIYTLAVSTQVPPATPATLAGPVREVIRFVDPQHPVYNVQTMEQVVVGSVADRRLYLWLLGAFAGIALVLAAAGIYGVISYSVSQRTREIGIRMALGAGAQTVRAMVVKHGARLALLGLAIGLPSAFALTRLLQGLLHGVSATDPATFIAVGVLLAAVALLASYLPARRASRVDPMVALRAE